MDITVVDAGANLKAFIRMDEAWIGSIDIAIKKARTARFFDMPTGEIGKLSQPGGSLYNIEHSNGGLITFPGGIPLRNSENEIIGASLSGWGAGVMIMRYGYEFTFVFFGAAAILGALLVCLIWKAGPRTHTVD